MPLDSIVRCYQNMNSYSLAQDIEEDTKSIPPIVHEMTKGYKKLSSSSCVITSNLS